MAGKEPEDDFDADERKPLYRDEVAADGPSPDAGEPADPADPTASAEPTEVSTRVTRGGRRPLTDDETQILPRTQRTSYVGSRSDFDRSDDDDLDALVDERRQLGQRTKLALLIAAVAAVAIVGLAIGYAVLNLGDRPSGTSGGNPTAGTSTGGTASPSPDPAALLTDATMLSASQARAVAADRTWKVALTQRGIDANSPAPACLGPDVVTGQPASQQTVLRLLSSTGKLPPGALHQADSYATAEEAAQAYALDSKALGGCAMAGASIDSGRVVSGLGDQATGLVVSVTQAGKKEFRSVVLNRTGRVVNVVDVAQPTSAAAVDGVAKALAAVTKVQCRTSGGRCAADPAVKDGPPPLGGDQPGFLATADLPPVSQNGSRWAGTVPALPDADFTGTGCETTNWAKVDAARRTARTYLLADDSAIFGLDEIVISAKSDTGAQDLATKVRDDLSSCAKRKLTATVSQPEKVKGVGASRTDVTGWTATVSQKTSTGTTGFRVGVVSAGNKTVYAFLNPQKGLDLTDAQWAVVVVRAGQRATQVK